MLVVKPYPLKMSQTPLYGVEVVPTGDSCSRGVSPRKRAGGPLTSVYQTTDRSTTHSDDEE